MAATDDLARLVDLVRATDWRLVAVGDPAPAPRRRPRRGVRPLVRHRPPHRARRPPTVPPAVGSRRQPRCSAPATPTPPTRTPTTAASTPPTPRCSPLDVARTHQRHVAAGRTVAITTNTAETARAINLAIQRATARAVARCRARRRHHRATSATRSPPAATTRTCAPTAGRRSATATPGPSPPSTRTARSPSPTPTEATVELPARYVAEHVELGWAVTGYGNQGDTVDVGIAVLEPGTTRNHAYVAMTRGRHTNHAVIPDPTGTDDPAELLAQIIARPANGESALAVQDRLHRAAGLEPPASAGRAPR